MNGFHARILFSYLWNSFLQKQLHFRLMSKLELIENKTFMIILECLLGFDKTLRNSTFETIMSHLAEFINNNHINYRLLEHEHKYFCDKFQIIMFHVMDDQSLNGQEIIFQCSNLVDYILPTIDSNSDFEDLITKHEFNVLKDYFENSSFTYKKVILACLKLSNEVY